jgi:putative transposase
LAAIRHVERNPVRARMIAWAEEYPWSSAAAHCGLKTDPVLSIVSKWQRQLDCIKDWSAWLAEGDEQPSLDTLRRHAERCLPCGSREFVKAMEEFTGRALRCRPRGRPAGSNGRQAEKGARPL